jgi:hypothetical protein
LHALILQIACRAMDRMQGAFTRAGERFSPECHEVRTVPAHVMRARHAGGAAAMIIENGSAAGSSATAASPVYASA